MQTRRDQLHAYRYMTRRAMSALVTGEPDAVEPPMRRITLMTVSGIMIAIVVAAVFAVVGLLKGGGGDDWRAEGAVVMERETGARYVMIEGQLHPVANYASAVLATGASNRVEVHQASREDLAAVERGPAIGIVGLPDSMPGVDDLVAGPITVCSSSQAVGVNVGAVVEVQVGSDTSALLLEPDEAAYVESFEGERFLLLDGRRHPVSPAVESALQISTTPTRVGSSFLTAIPLGKPFATPTVPGAGQTVTLGGQQVVVGQVVEVDDGTFRVVLEDGLARVSEVQARLLRTAVLGDRRIDPVRMPFSTVIEMGESGGTTIAETAGMSGLPEVMPLISVRPTEASGACMVFGDVAEEARLGVPAVAGAGQPTSESDASAHGAADTVDVAPGAGMLVATEDSTLVYVITAPGKSYAAQSVDVLAGFGYSGEDVVRVRAEVLGIIPDGAALDPVAARTPVGG